MIAVTASGGCVLGPNYRAPSAADLKVPPGFSATTARSKLGAADMERWWQGFGDLILTRSA